MIRSIFCLSSVALFLTQASSVAVAADASTRLGTSMQLPANRALLNDFSGSLQTLVLDDERPALKPIRMAKAHYKVLREGLDAKVEAGKDPAVHMDKVCEGDVQVPVYETTKTDDAEVLPETLCETFFRDSWDKASIKVSLDIAYEIVLNRHLDSNREPLKIFYSGLFMLSPKDGDFNRGSISTPTVEDLGLQKVSSGVMIGSIHDWNDGAEVFQLDIRFDDSEK